MEARLEGASPQTSQEKWEELRDMFPTKSTPQGDMSSKEWTNYLARHKFHSWVHHNPTVYCAIPSPEEWLKIPETTLIAIGRITTEQEMEMSRARKNPTYAANMAEAMHAPLPTDEDADL